MRAVVQRVSRAKVTVNGEITGEIGLGLLVLLGVGREDDEADAVYLAEKISGLRVFEDDAVLIGREAGRYRPGEPLEGSKPAGGGDTGTQRLVGEGPEQRGR